ncbi:hypothetical protein Tco_0945387, partial [Tanacetum coccineum]
MEFTQVSTSKRPKITIIPPTRVFIDLTNEDTTTPSPICHTSSPSAPNAPSKTPSTRGTSSSSIKGKLNSPTSSSLTSSKDYLNSPISPPPRVPPPPPIQANQSMEITLNLSPKSPLDFQINPPSPLFGHPIQWNLLEAHALHTPSVFVTRYYRDLSNEKMSSLPTLYDLEKEMKLEKMIKNFEQARED